MTHRSVTRPAPCGHALAAAAGTDYATLLDERLLRPLTMNATYLPRTANNLDRDAPTGYSASGAPVAPWTIDGWAPAGDAHSMAADMGRFAQGLLNGTGCGPDALTPVSDLDAQPVGYGWHVRGVGGRR